MKEPSVGLGTGGSQKTVTADFSNLKVDKKLGFPESGMPFSYIINHLPLKILEPGPAKTYTSCSQNGATPSQKADNCPHQGLRCTLLGERGSHEEWGDSGFFWVESRLTPSAPTQFKAPSGCQFPDLLPSVLSSEFLDY